MKSVKEIISEGYLPKKNTNKLYLETMKTLRKLIKDTKPDSELSKQLQEQYGDTVEDDFKNIQRKLSIVLMNMEIYK